MGYHVIQILSGVEKLWVIANIFEIRLSTRSELSEEVHKSSSIERRFGFTNIYFWVFEQIMSDKKHARLINVWVVGYTLHQRSILLSW